MQITFGPLYYRIIESMEEKSTLLGRLTDSVKRDYVKMGHLGYGKYIALFTFALYFTLELEILKVVWPLVHGSIPDIPLYVIAIVVPNIVVTILYNIPMYFIYTRKIPFFEQFRTNKNALWPWESNPSEWNGMFWKTIKINLRNIFIVAPLLSYFDAMIDFKIKMDMESVPHVSTMLWQIPLFILANEISFYWVHRIVHHPKLYWIHKQHHEYNVTITLAAQYAHPIEHILANSIPVGLGYKYLSKVYPVHIFTILIWLTFRMFETYDGHSGYSWPWGQSQLLPFCGGGPYHYFHHKQNVENYGGVLSLFDTIFDTNKIYYRFLKAESKKSN